MTPEPSTPLLLYADEWLVAVCKPPGLAVHRSPEMPAHEPAALQWVRDHCGRYVHPVHRLDRGTSGVLVFAFTAPVARALGLQFEEGRVRKQYLALVRGWPPESGTLDHALRRLDPAPPRDDRGRATQPQPAITTWRRLARREEPVALGPHPTSRYALVHVEPLTGRQHQIRRHFKHLGHPLIGDSTYGKGAHNRWWAAELGLQRLWLHAHRLSLTHPGRGHELELVAPLGHDWQALFDRAGWSWDEPTMQDALRG